MRTSVCGLGQEDDERAACYPRDKLFVALPLPLTTSSEPGRSERREMDEQNDEEQREQRSKDAAQQPELTPSQNEQPVPARAAGWRQTRFLRTKNVCGHVAPRYVSGY